MRRSATTRPPGHEHLRFFWGASAFPGPRSAEVLRQGMSLAKPTTTIRNTSTTFRTTVGSLCRPGSARSSVNPCCSRWPTVGQSSTRLTRCGIIRVPRKSFDLTAPMKNSGSDIGVSAIRLPDVSYRHTMTGLRAKAGLVSVGAIASWTGGARDARSLTCPKHKRIDQFV